MRRGRIPDLVPIPDQHHTTLARGISRRSFLRIAATGTLGASLLLSGAGEIFAAAPVEEKAQGAQLPNSSGSPSESGEVVLDGLMLTYFCIPPAFGGSTFTFGRNFSSAFTLKLPADESVELKAATAPEKQMILNTGHVQRASTWVKDAIVITRQPENEMQRSSETFTTRNGSEPVQIYGLIKPTLRFLGTPDNLTFFISNPGERTFNLGKQVDPATSATMYSQYVTDPALLFPPRFYWSDVHVDAGESLEFSLPSRLAVRNGITSTVTARIVDQSGFRSPKLIQAFAPGNTIEVTYHSAQELASPSVMDIEMTTDTSADNRVYIDRIFKTFIMTQKAS